MRNYHFFNQYLNELEKDTYYQPQNGDMHLVWATDIIDQWVSELDVMEVLDVGCGVGFCQPIFEKYDIQYEGITTNTEDLQDGHKKGRNISGEDYNFIDSNANSYDLVFARHSLEHSPFPVLTLMEWHRVAKRYLIVVNPKPEYVTWVGRNHYSVATVEQLRFWMERAGWRVIKENITANEIWLQAEKVERKIPYYEK